MPRLASQIHNNKHTHTLTNTHKNTCTQTHENYHRNMILNWINSPPTLLSIGQLMMCSFVKKKKSKRWHRYEGVTGSKDGRRDLTRNYWSEKRGRGCKAMLPYIEILTFTTIQQLCIWNFISFTRCPKILAQSYVAYVIISIMSPHI